MPRLLMIIVILPNDRRPGVQAKFHEASAPDGGSGHLPAGSVTKNRQPSGGQQRLGIGMKRAAKQRIAAGGFHQLTEVHHRHVVAQMLYNSKVMGDE